MPNFSEFTYLSADGKSNIFAKVIAPDCEPRGIIQISHGISEHIGRYDDFARFVCSKGFVAVGNDHLGHGRTAAESGEYGFFSELRGWDMAVYDMRRLTEFAVAKYRGIPLFLLGHSMGSFLVRTYIIRHSAWISGAILSGSGQHPVSLLNAGISLAKREERKHGPKYHSKRAHRFTLSLRRSAARSERPQDWLSRDTTVADRFIADELTGHKATVSLLRDMMEGMRYNSMPGNLDNMNKDLPVLFFSGDNDPVGANGLGVMRAHNLFISAGMKDVTMKLYSGGRHEMLNEINKSEVYADVISWVESKLGAAKTS